MLFLDWPLLNFVLEIVDPCHNAVHVLLEL